MKRMKVLLQKTVLETYIREVTTLVHLTVNGEEIVTTETHPFYVNNRGFVNAGELIVGDELLDVNGNVLLVENFDVELTDKPVKVYNFQVEDFHTYYAGGLGVLVHNASNEYKTKTVRTAKGEEKIPIVDKPGSPSWKQAVKELRSARKKGNNYIASNRQQAEQLINEAMPDRHVPHHENREIYILFVSDLHPDDSLLQCHRFSVHAHY